MSQDEAKITKHDETTDEVEAHAKRAGHPRKQ